MAKASTVVKEEVLPATETPELFDLVISDPDTGNDLSTRFNAAPSLVAGIVDVLTYNGYKVVASANRKIDVTEELKASLL